MNEPAIKIFILSGGKMPERKSEGAVGYDVFIRALVSPDEFNEKRPWLRKTVLDFFDMPENWNMAKKCFHNPIGRYNLIYRMEPGEIVFSGLGFIMEMEFPVFNFLIPRSGLASKGLVISNTPGLTDSDYRGELIAQLYNRSDKEFDLQYGMRIGQIVFQRALIPNITKIESYGELTPTERASGALGSTGEK